MRLSGTVSQLELFLSSCTKGNKRPVDKLCLFLTPRSTNKQPSVPSSSHSLQQAVSSLCCWLPRQSLSFGGVPEHPQDLSPAGGRPSPVYRGWVRLGGCRCWRFHCLSRWKSVGWRSLRRSGSGWPRLPSGSGSGLSSSLHNSPPHTPVGLAWAWGAVQWQRGGEREGGGEKKNFSDKKALTSFTHKTREGGEGLWLVHPAAKQRPRESHLFLC